MLRTRQKIALARMVARPLRLARRLAGLGDWIEVRRRGIRWRLDLGDGIDLAIYLFGGFEIRTRRAYERIVETGQLVLDIGANVGAHTLPLAKRVGEDGRVVAFEPTSYAFAKLQRNLELNAALGQRITAEQLMLCAANDVPLEPALYASWPLDDVDALHPVHRGLARSTAGARAVTLDDYLASRGLGPVSLIKIDVDGFECDILAGAAETVRSSHPLLVLELAPDALREKGHRVADLLDWLDRYDYRLESLVRRRPLPMSESWHLRRIPPGGSVNVLAFPSTGGQRPR